MYERVSNTSRGGLRHEPKTSMTIYVDAAFWHWRGLKWCHLLADDVDELHRFAANLGIKRTSFQSPPKVRAAHYDLTGYERLRAIAMGAVPCDGHQIVAVLCPLERGRCSYHLWTNCNLLESQPLTSMTCSVPTVRFAPLFESRAASDSHQFDVLCLRCR